MSLLKSLLIAFSIYSKIPVRQFTWNENEIKYLFCFFPWVGAVAGGCVYLWNRFCYAYDVGALCRVTVTMAILLFLTGGIHVDGFMDTMDAFHSYQPRERKLEILKDAHIGAFAVIMLAAYGLVYAGAFSEIEDQSLLCIVCCGFFLSRCLCGISVVSFPLAKQDGMLFLFVSGAQKKIVRVSLCLQGIVCIGIMLAFSLFAGGLVTAAALLSFAAYAHQCRKALGGITGDTSGYFILLSEICMLIAAAAINILT